MSSEPTRSASFRVLGRTGLDADDLVSGDRSRRDGPSVDVMKPIPRPRLWVRLASVVALGFALWLLLVPRIALYYLDNDNGHVDDDQPYGVDVKYAWGRGTSDQMLIVPAHGWGDEDPIAWHGGVDGMVSHVRLNCGLVFTSGDNEAKAPGGAAACAEIETPRLIGGILLALLGITGLGLAGRIRSSWGGEHIRGTDDLFRVDDISTLDHPVLGEDPEGKP